MSQSRTKYSIINIIFSFTSAVLKLVLLFFVQQQLVKYLGYDLVGVNRTCTSIISMLSVTELGIGSAITFCLYEPIAKKNELKIALLIRLYKIIYFIMAGIILIGVAVTMPFIKVITKSEYELGYLCLVYFLFALNAIITYLFSFNQTLLIADQKEYLVNIPTMIFTTIMYVVQFVVLYMIKYFADQAKLFFVIYLIAAIVFTFICNLFIYVLVRRKYPYTIKPKGKLEDEDKKLIKTKVGALIYHRVGNYLVTGTDTIIISSVLTSVVAGITGNYYTITTALTTVFGKIASAMLPSFGNLIVEADGDKVYRTYKIAQFPLFIIYVVFGIGFICLSDMFISKIWLNSDGLMDIAFVVLMGVNFFITGYSGMLGNVRFAAGKFEPDKYLHIIIAILNLAISIGLVFVWGAAGVLVGTLICLLIKECSVLPHICCKHIFKNSYFKFMIKQLIEFSIFGILCAACWFICNSFDLKNVIGDFILKGFICVIFPAVVIILCYLKTEEMSYYISALKKLFKIKKNTDIQH